MKIKRKTAVLVAVGLLSVSLVGFARHHWSPWDPSTYWNPWVIDWADTNDPGHYFYHDLANNGMQVRDESRLAKSISFLENFVNELATRRGRVALAEQNTTPLSAEEFSAFASNMDKVAQNTMKIASSAANEVYNENGIFRDREHAMDPRYTYSNIDQMEYSEKIYKEIIEAARLNEEDLEYRSQLLQDTLGVSAEAVGELAAIQANSQMQDIYVQQLIRKNALLNNYLALLTLRAKKEQNEKIQAQENLFRTFAAKIRDPYNPEEDNSNYVKSKPKGFVHFE